MKLLIHDLQDAEPVMLAACLAKARQWYAGVVTDVTATLFVNPPDKGGSTEYGLVLPNASQGVFYLCCLRRAGSEKVEFHS